MQKKLFFPIFFLLITYPQAYYLQSLIYYCFKEKFCIISVRSTLFVRKGKDPDPYPWLTDPDGPKNMPILRIRIPNTAGFNALPWSLFWSSPFSALPFTTLMLKSTIFSLKINHTWHKAIREGCSVAQLAVRWATVSSVADPDPNPDPHGFGPPGSGSISQRYGSGSDSGFFYHHAKIVGKTLNPTIMWLFLTF